MRKIPRLHYLDSMRGIAALLVVLMHGLRIFVEEKFTTSSMDYIFTNIFTEFLDVGKVGVVIFFFISGFVVPYSLIGKDGREGIVQFSKSRFFRLFPVYWLSILVGGLVVWPYVHGTEPDVLTYIVNLTMNQAVFGVDHIVGVYWTLQIEIIFYVLVAALFYFGVLFSFKHIFFMSMGFLFVSLVFSLIRCVLEKKIPVAVPLSLSIMFFGMIYRGSVVEHDLSAKKYTKLYLAAFVLFLPPITVLAYSFDSGHSETWYRYFVSYFVGIIGAVVLSSKIRIANHVSRFLGKISYSLYLFHMPVFILSIGLFPFFKSLEFSPAAIFVFTVLVAIAVSSMSEKFVERPFYKFGKSVFKKRVVGAVYK